MLLTGIVKLKLFCLIMLRISLQMANTANSYDVLLLNSKRSSLIKMAFMHENRSTTRNHFFVKAPQKKYFFNSTPNLK
jgi:hypothetical protein